MIKLVQLYSEIKLIRHSTTPENVIELNKEISNLTTWGEKGENFVGEYSRILQKYANEENEIDLFNFSPLQLSLIYNDLLKLKQKIDNININEDGDGGGASFDPGVGEQYATPFVFGRKIKRKKRKKINRK